MQAGAHSPSGARNSIWFHLLGDARRHLDEASPELPSAADVVIIGGGIVGLACAFYLTERGVRDVVVVERDTLAARASGANAGGLWPNQQSKKPGLWKTLADNGLELLAELAERDDFDFQFRRNGILTLICDPEELERAPARVAQMREQGFRFRFVTQSEIRELEPLLTEDVLGGIFCPSDAHCNPLRLALCYARHATRRGARIVTHTEVASPGRAGPAAAGSPIRRLRTSRGEIAANCFICANGAWLPHLTEPLGRPIPITPARGQMLATEPLPPLLKTSVIARYMFTQLVSGHIISGGTVEFAGFEDHTSPDVIDEIWREARRALPALERGRVLTTWSGLRPHTPDELPVIGPLPGFPELIVAAGHFKNGVLFSALTGKLVSELIVDGSASMDLAPLSVERFAFGE